MGIRDWVEFGFAGCAKRLVTQRVFLMDLEVYAKSFGKLIERDCAHYKR